MVMIFRVGLWNGAMEKTGHMKGLTSLVNVCKSAVKFMAIHIESERTCRFENQCSTFLDNDAVAKDMDNCNRRSPCQKSENFCSLRLCLFFSDSGVFSMR